jgi:hypothetical protein
MPQTCQQFWPRSAVPPEYFWLMPIIMPLLALILLFFWVCRLQVFCIEPVTAADGR